MSEGGRRALRERPGVSDLLQRHRWLATGVGAASAGGFIALSLVIADLGLGTALAGGACVAVVVFVFFAVASRLAGRPILPFDLEYEDPQEIDKDVRFETEAEADRESTRRNMREGASGVWWIQTQLPSGEWTVEHRGRRAPVRDPDHGGGGWIFGDGGGGGDGGG